MDIKAKLGFIGFGNMGSAICDGLIKAEAVSTSNIFIPIYVMFLQSMKEDEDLQELYKKLQEKLAGHGSTCL